MFSILWNVLLRHKCPRCHCGDLFIRPFSLKTAFQMHERCPCCGLDFNPEPGFYFGAMFISYIITGWLFVLAAFALIYLGHIDVNLALGIVVVGAIPLYLFFFRLGRAAWLAINFKYSPEAHERCCKK